MDDIRIKASPQTLNAGAEEVRKTAVDIRSSFSNIEAAVNRSRGYWQGESAEAHRQVWQDMKEETERILTKLHEHAVDLQSIARTYLEAEEGAADQTDSLPSDVIL